MDIAYLDVNLEVESKSDLTPLVEDLGEDVIVQYSGRMKAGYLASFALEACGTDPDSTISEMCCLIENLSDEGQRLWQSAYRRTFDIGYESGDSTPSFRSEIREETIRAVGALGASLIVTIYPMRTEEPPDLSDDLMSRISGQDTNGEAEHEDG